MYHLRCYRFLLAILGLCLALLAGCGPAADDDDDSAGEPLPLETQRRVLHEWFTGSNCSPCAPAAARLEEVLAANPGAYTVLKYQIGSDPYVTREGVNRRMWYLPDDAENYSIPYTHCDGLQGFHPNEINDDESAAAAQMVAAVRR